MKNFMIILMVFVHFDNCSAERKTFGNGLYDVLFRPIKMDSNDGHFSVPATKTAEERETFLKNSQEKNENILVKEGVSEDDLLIEKPSAKTTKTTTTTKPTTVRLFVSTDELPKEKNGGKNISFSYFHHASTHSIRL